jgi:hypothetical protein
MSDTSPALLQNGIFIPEDDLYLVSTHRHDYVCHKLSDGKEICVDGGREYARRAGDLFELSEAERYVEMCLVEGEPFEGWITERLLWGTRDKDGSQPMRYRPIKELAQAPDGAAHMRAILDNCLNISPLHKRVVEYWLAKVSQPSPST